MSERRSESDPARGQPKEPLTYGNGAFPRLALGERWMIWGAVAFVGVAFFIVVVCLGVASN